MVDIGCSGVIGFFGGIVFVITIIVCIMDEKNRRG